MESIPKIIADSISVLSDKFGATGVKLWEILVQGTFAESVVYSTIGVIMVIISYKIAKYQVKRLEKIAGNFQVFTASQS